MNQVLRKRLVLTKLLIYNFATTLMSPLYLSHDNIMTQTTNKQQQIQRAVEKLISAKKHQN